jgi:hypothetical protein
VLGLLTVAVAGWSGGCAGRRIAGDSALPFERASQQTPVRELWSKKFSGFITDLNIARNSGETLVTTRPDYDEPGGERSYRISLFSPKGKRHWSRTLDGPVKSQDIARDGSLAVFATYESRMNAIGADGKRAWSVEASCKPIVLESMKRIVCYHDDDAGPNVAFDVYDWTGKKLSSYGIRNDVLTLKVSRDEQNLVLGLTRGQITFFRGDFKKPTWKQKVNGEIADVAVSSGERPKVAVLFNKPRKGQRIAVFDFQGHQLSEGEPSDHVSQLELAIDGTAVFAYGNGPRGQNLAFFALGTDKDLDQTWIRQDARYADYSAPMLVIADSAIIGFEEFTPAGRDTHLLGFGSDGKILWDVPLQTDQGAYLYAQAYSPEQALLAVGTDDSRLTAYQIGK